MPSSETLLNRVLRRGEDIGLLASAVALILVESGYVAWLERLPAFPNSSHPAGFLDLPPWYEHPRVEVTLLLTILGGVIASAVWGVSPWCAMAPPTLPRMNDEIARKRLKTAAFYAIVSGAELLFIQFLRT